MQETIEELKDIISELAQDEKMCSLTYHAILTRLDYLETEFLKLNKHFVSNSCCDNPELDKGMQLGFGKKLCKHCGGHIAI